MPITYQIARSKDDLVHLAEVCLNAGLYEPDGLLKNYYTTIMKRRQVRKMTILTLCLDTLPIGVIVLFDTANHINTYVKPEYRKGGYGSLLIKELRSRVGLDNSLLIGVAGFGEWEQFYARNFVYINKMTFSTDDIDKYKGRSSVVAINFKAKRTMLAAFRASKKSIN